MTLTVLSVAYPFAPVGPDAVGGAEQVLGQLDRALVAAGHRSIVVAAAGSTPSGTLLPGAPIPFAITDSHRQIAWALHRRLIDEALCKHPVDIVHMHGLDFWKYLPARSDVPILVTLHLPPSWYPPEVFSASRDDVHPHCVSTSQLQACPPHGRQLPVITNGVPVEALDARVRKRRFALVLGRICPEKNVHVALEAGRRAGLPVLLGGQVFPYEDHQLYFHREVLPRLADKRHYLGPLAFARKRRLLAAARCLLLPTLAPETSSLVAMEALACGTPVVAFPSGALPEIVEHGVTGFLVNDAVAMADAIEACAQLDPERCRAVARERFALQGTMARYFDVYARLARNRQQQRAWALAA
jgi:glycosyltransferase involved in cell wall biosynthesis